MYVLLYPSPVVYSQESREIFLEWSHFLYKYIDIRKKKKPKKKKKVCAGNQNIEKFKSSFLFKVSYFIHKKASRRCRVTTYNERKIDVKIRDKEKGSSFAVSHKTR